MKTISAIIAASVLFSSTAAFAFGDIVLIAPAAKEQPDRGNGTGHPFPYDNGRMNESPIRGAGRISVVHNEPPTESTESKITAVCSASTGQRLSVLPAEAPMSNLSQARDAVWEALYTCVIDDEARRLLRLALRLMRRN